jgi:hypothetical protein
MLHRGKKATHREHKKYHFGSLIIET